MAGQETAVAAKRRREDHAARLSSQMLKRVLTSVSEAQDIFGEETAVSAEACQRSARRELKRRAKERKDQREAEAGSVSSVMDRLERKAETDARLASEGTLPRKIRRAGFERVREARVHGEPLQEHTAEALQVTAYTPDQDQHAKSVHGRVYGLASNNVTVLARLHRDSEVTDGGLRAGHRYGMLCAWVYGRATALRTASLGETRGGSGDTLLLEEMEADQRDHFVDRRRSLTEADRALSARQRMALTAVTHHGQTLAEAGAAMFPARGRDKREGMVDALVMEACETLSDLWGYEVQMARTA